MKLFQYILLLKIVFVFLVNYMCLCNFVFNKVFGKHTNDNGKWETVQLVYSHEYSSGIAIFIKMLANIFRGFKPDVKA